MLRAAVVAALCIAVQCVVLPRGVPRENAPFYDPSKDFRCLDGSQTIPFSLVNDDFCDCPDGSDEPGTAACSHGRFFCQNDGHQGHFLQTSRVNDRICDCCDGSDEYDSGISCPNICDDLGKAAREERTRQAAVARKGYQVRLQMATKGTDMKKEKEAALAPLKAERDELEPKRKELEDKKREAENKENDAKDAFRKQWEAERDQKKRAKAEQTFAGLDLNADGKLSAEEMKTNLVFDANNDLTVDDEDIKSYLIDAQEVDMETFIAQIYDRIKYLLKEKTEEKKAEQEEAEADDLIAAGFATTTTSTTTPLPSTEAPVPVEPEPESEDDHIDDKYYEDMEEEEPEHYEDEDKIPDPEPPRNEDDDEERMPPYPAEVQTLVDEAQKARDAYQEVNNRAVTLDGDIRDIESFIQQDYGVDNAWAALKGECFELNDMQYVYKLCPFDRTVQKDKNGYSETGLGNFAGWTGAEPRKYSQQMYDKGQQCWNGPQRSTKVIIECGEENELLSTSEPAKCEYEFTFKTPAACQNPDDVREPPHQEL